MAEPTKPSITDQSVEPQSVSQPPKTKFYSRLVWIVAALVIGFMAWNFVSSRLPKTPFTLERDSTGNLVPVATNGSGAPPASAVNIEAALIDAKNSVNSFHGSSHSANAAFPCRRVTIINHSDHPLLQSIGELLPGHLSSLRFIDHVDYYPANTFPPVGSQSADLWITLDLGRIKTSGIVPRSALEVKVDATVGSTLAGGSYSRSDSMTVPKVRFNWTGTIDHKSTTTGFTSDRFSLAAKNIAKELTKSLVKPIEALHEKHGPFPPLNDAFYPAYTPTPAVMTFEDWDAEQIISSHGMMVSNETFWRVTTTDSIAAKLKDLQRRFEEGGWKTRHLDESERQPHLSMTRDEECLNIFRSRRRATPGSDVTISFDADKNDADKNDAEPEPKTVYVHYLDRLDATEIREAIDQQFDGNGPIESLLLLSRRLTDDQRGRFVELLEQHKSNSPRAWLILAEEYHASKQNDKARSTLRRAHWLAKFDPITKGQTNATTTLAKKWKAEELLKEPASVELFQELGFAELKPDEPTDAVEVGLNEPAFFYGIDKSGDWHVLSWRVKPDGTGAEGWRYKLAQSRVSGGTRSWTSGNLLTAREMSKEYHGIPELGTVTLEVKRQADERFRFVGKLVPQ